MKKHLEEIPNEKNAKSQIFIVKLLENNYLFENFPEEKKRNKNTIKIEQFFSRIFWIVFCMRREFFLLEWKTWKVKETVVFHLKINK